ncbi:unnamed protein product [Rhizophagus irregularis]|nr:unnamed protein product [Rhizophagus irregularis]
MITGGSFVPSAIQAKTIVKFEHSCPVDRIKTVLVPACSIVVLLDIEYMKEIHVVALYSLPEVIEQLSFSFY